MSGEGDESDEVFPVFSREETDYFEAAQAWERTDITTDEWELLTATAEEYLLGTIHDRPYFNSDTHGNNERR